MHAPVTLADLAPTLAWAASVVPLEPLDGRVLWENGASLSVVDAMGYPNRAAGGNAHGWCKVWQPKPA